MIAEIPSIRKILAILLPRILPTAISVDPWKLAYKLTASSGADVPKATKVKPTIRSDILNLLASAEAPSTRKSAPLITKKKLIMNNAYVNINSQNLLSGVQMVHIQRLTIFCCGKGQVAVG